MNSMNDRSGIERRRLQQENSIDIYEFYPVLYSLFKDLGVLATDHQENDRLSFKFIRPDEVYQNSQNVVTLDLGARQYAEQNGRTQVNHRSIGEVYNTVTGQNEETFVIQFQNEVSLTIYSEKYNQLLRVVEFIEDVILKHRGSIEQYVEKIHYIGTTETAYISNSASTKLQSKTIKLLVYTVKTYVRTKELIQYIK